MTHAHEDGRVETGRSHFIYLNSIPHGRWFVKHFLKFFRGIFCRGNGSRGFPYGGLTGHPRGGGYQTAGHVCFIGFDLTDRIFVKFVWHLPFSCAYRRAPRPSEAPATAGRPGYKKAYPTPMGWDRIFLISWSYNVGVLCSFVSFEKVRYCNALFLLSCYILA